MPRNDTLYGNGLRFPLVPRGGLATVSGPDAVVQSIRTILLTGPGERVGRPVYGCGLRQYLFASNNVATRALIRKTVMEAVERDEPRVLIEAVDVLTPSESSTRVDIHIRYRLREERSPRSLVFPFYLDDRST